ncbi:MAG TPA: hypoxanthine phosphoribosyltransferase, partial [Arachnia sp.]|nr:hypoxanthine phosphoribosyltransferase [Arachnia sp.]
MEFADIAADLDEVLLSPEQIQERIAELAREIDADYRGKDVLAVGVLKGAVMVMADLVRAMTIDVQMDWMAV